jgi:gamma-glutamylcyclotransferase (GGCT)/AIG2-like uncharacterized protein YtfP
VSPAADMISVDEPGEDTRLFVYGSLLDHGRRRQIIGRRVDTVPATIRDYQLGSARYFFIRQVQGVSTPGLLLLNLTPEDFERLDRYEELPRLYTREKVEAFDEGGHKIRCWAYLPTAFTIAGKK